MLPMLDARHDPPLCRTVAGKLVGDHDARRPALPLQQLAQEPFGGPFVPPALHQDVEHEAVLIYCAPYPMLLAGDFHRNFVEMPFISSAGQPSPDPVGEVLAELARPLPHGFMADDDAAGSQHLLDHAQAEREAEIEPNRVADDLGRKPVAGIAGASWCPHPIRLRDLARYGKPPT